MDNKIRVLHVVGRMDCGGTESLLMSILRVVDKEKFQYDFVEQTMDKCDHDDEIISLGSKIYRCPKIALNNIKDYRLWWRKFFKEHPEYRIIHGHSHGSAPIYIDEANRAGRITIFHCHNPYEKNLKGAVSFIWQYPLRKKPDYLFACSADAGRSLFGKKSQFDVIKNGIQTEKFLWNKEIRQQVRKIYNLKDEFVVGNVARFVDQKNHKFLIDIFREILKKKENSRLMLVGYGELEEEIKEKVKSLGIEDKVIFTGVKNNVNELLQAMDVFVLPSLFEGLGIVNIEAQAAGVPCFVSDKVVPKDVRITDLLEFISLNDSPKIWADRVIDGYLQKNERNNMYEEIVKSGFDIKNTSDWLCSFYEEKIKNDSVKQ